MPINNGSILFVRDNVTSFFSLPIRFMMNVKIPYAKAKIAMRDMIRMKNISIF